VSRAARCALGSGAKAASRACASSSESPRRQSSCGSKPSLRRSSSSLKWIWSTHWFPRSSRLSAPRWSKPPAIRWRTSVRPRPSFRSNSTARSTSPTSSRPARIGAKNPNLAHPRQVPALAARHATEETLDPLPRLRALHLAWRRMRPTRAWIIEGESLITGSSHARPTRRGRTSPDGRQVGPTEGRGDGERAAGSDGEPHCGGGPRVRQPSPRRVLRKSRWPPSPGAIALGQSLPG
jgi:hypothetical protein